MWGSGEVTYLRLTSSHERPSARSSKPRVLSVTHRHTYLNDGHTIAGNPTFKNFITQDKGTIVGSTL